MFVKYLFLFLNSCFQKALLRESWLEDMTTVLQESVIPSSNLQAVDAATKRHEAITADVMARVSVFEHNESLTF